MVEAPEITTGTPVHGARMTVEQFMQLPETNQIIELLNDEVVMTPAPTVDHQDIVLATALYLKQIAPSGKVNISPNDVHLAAGHVVQPDVFWVSGENTQCQVGADRRWHGPPDLVVKVLSPSTVSRDRGEKFDLYAQNGVREYWLVEPVTQTVEVFVWQDDAFARQGWVQREGTFASPVLGGQEIEIAQLFS